MLGDLGIYGLGFRVWGLGFGVEGVGLRVQGFRCDCAFELHSGWGRRMSCNAHPPTQITNLERV